MRATHPLLHSQERKKRTFDQLMERSISHEIRQIWGKVGYAKWNRSYWPAKCVSPKDVGGDARAEWEQHCSELEEGQEMKLIVRWYGASNPDEMFGLVDVSDFCCHDNRGLGRIRSHAATLKTKRESGKKLSDGEEERLVAEQEMEQELRRQGQGFARGYHLPHQNHSPPHERDDGRGEPTGSSPKRPRHEDKQPQQRTSHSDRKWEANQMHTRYTTTTTTSNMKAKGPSFHPIKACIDKSAEERHQLLTKNKSLEAKVAQLEDTVKAGNDKSAEEKKELLTKNKSLEAKVAQLEEELDNQINNELVLQQKTTCLEQKVEEQSQAVSSLDAQYQSQISELQATIAEKDQALQGLALSKQQVVGLTTERDLLLTQCRQHAAEMEVSTKEKMELLQTLLRRKNEVSDITKERDSLREQTRALLCQLQQATKEKNAVVAAHEERLQAQALKDRELLEREAQIGGIMLESAAREANETQLKKTVETLAKERDDALEAAKASASKLLEMQQEQESKSDELQLWKSRIGNVLRDNAILRIANEDLKAKAKGLVVAVNDVCDSTKSS